ncbi:MAG: hypothetical protein DRI69_01130 [Bacteroidetes bacterium]|nr:MAG: hypothetical protein DRI69_01130 [Bacteroidota bacterium]
MTTNQIKAEIIKALDQVPEAVLNDVLEYLNDRKRMSGAQILRTKRMRRMLEEDSNLLQKLAE